MRFVFPLLLSIAATGRATVCGIDKMHWQECRIPSGTGSWQTVMNASCPAYHRCGSNPVRAVLSIRRPLGGDPHASHSPHARGLSLTHPCPAHPGDAI